MAPRVRRPTGQKRPLGPWKNGPIPVIGLVGGIGSGKSTAAARFAAAGAFVIDADKVGHALLDQRPVRELIARRFGTAVLALPAVEGGEPTIDRRALGAIVFTDPTALKALESILHPRMRRTFEKAIARVARRKQGRAVVLDAAILFEAGWNDLCDRVFFVDAPHEARLSRIVNGRGWDEEKLAARERTQWPLERKKSRASGVLSNVAGTEELNAEVDRAWREVRKSTPPRRPALDRPQAPAPSTGRTARRPGAPPGGKPRSRDR